MISKFISLILLALTVAVHAADQKACTEALQRRASEREQTLKILSLLNQKGYLLSAPALEKKKTEVQNIIFSELGIKIRVPTFIGMVKRNGGWVALKKEIGITYEGRARQDVGRPDWSKDFIIKVLQVAPKIGFDISYSSLYEKKRFALLKEAIKTELGYDIRGKTLYEWSVFVYGSLEAACKAANVSYVSEVKVQMPIKWKQWAADNSSGKFSPLVMIQILQFVSSQGYDPTPTLCENPANFVLIAQPLQARFGAGVTGPDIMRNAKRLYKKLELALKEAKVSQENLKPWSKDKIIKALAVVVKKYPDIIAEDMKDSLSVDIGLILRPDLGFQTSGYSLWRQIDRNGGLRALRTAANQIARADRRATESWPVGGTPSRELYLQVLTYINELGYFPSDDLLKDWKKFAPVHDAIQKKFGLDLSMRAIVESGKALFGDMPSARTAAGIGFKPPMVVDPGDALAALKIILKTYPAIGREKFLQMTSPELAKLLKDQVKLDCSGKKLLETLEANYGSLQGAYKQIGYVPPWSRANPPDKDRIVDIIKFIGSKGYGPLDGDFFHDPKKFAPARAAIQTELGYDLPGQSIYNYAFKRFGSNGIKKAVELAGYAPAPAAPAPKPVLAPDPQSAWPIGGCPKPDLYIKVLQFVAAQGTYPSRSWCYSAKDYAPVGAKVEEQFHFKVPGGTLVQCGNKLFGDYRAKALAAAGISIRKGAPVWSKDFVLQALALVLDQWPDITTVEMANSRSVEIGKLIQDKLHVQCSGDTLMDKIWEYFESFPNAKNLAGRGEFWPAEGPPSKPNYILIFKFLDEQGFVITGANLRDPAVFAPMKPLLQERFKADISGDTLYKHGLALFGSIENAKKAAGIVDKSTPILSVIEKNWSDNDAKAYYIKLLQFLRDKGFTVEPKLFRDKDAFKPAMAAIEAELHVRPAGNTVYNRLNDLFGGFENATDAAGVNYREQEADWTPDFTLTALLAVLKVWPDITISDIMHKQSQPIRKLLKQEFNIEDAAGVTLGRRIIDNFHNLYGAKLRLGFITPWMVGELKSPDLDRDQMIEILRALNELGLSPTASNLQDKSRQTAKILLEKFKLLMTGAALYARVRQLFPDGMELAWKAAKIRDDSTPVAAEKLSEMLKLVEEFGIEISAKSLKENSNAVAWITMLQFGVPLDGADLVWSAKKNYVPLQGTNPNTKTIGLTVATVPIVVKLLNDAGLVTRPANNVLQYSAQIQNIVRYHFGKEVDLDDLAAKVELYNNGQLAR